MLAKDIAEIKSVRKRWIGSQLNIVSQCLAIAMWFNFHHDCCGHWKQGPTAAGETLAISGAGVAQ
ncbi:hypothetical protein FIBSPDRAFT_867088 [Athelia psychrophila]|uniref:Uncharacterized protein n=1 Tax=Athelia psychrophila TaxID=1759441 RepID=A0A166E8V4_9AGAM|nr:hypothetical protein FIBSPDRAFT_875319 [Fibularhizoctonia sp. CBS 109695]KZP15518.1 hypothetical protein FIBSPDRAFT_867088 [Fibularhizoctonia sp. CBS 109695]